MAGYNGRRAPNFSQYLDDLNAIPSAYDQALQQQQQQGAFDLDDELAMFTNTEFFDFDNFGSLDLPSFDAVDEKHTQGEVSDHSPQSGDMKFLDFLNEGSINITDFQTDLSGVNAPQVHIQNAPFSAVPSVPNAPVAPAAAAPAAPFNAPLNVAPAPAQNVLPAAPAQVPAPAAPKRKNTQKEPQPHPEEAARFVAEEDKRRRNTAASARFRVKKKMREQALERTVKDTNDKNDALEARVSQLELENHWLRGLIMEKNGTEERDEQSEKAISDMFQSFLASRNEAPSKPSTAKHGVGTTV
ncbi:uncharacterized protein N7483_012117 [Penicillium malachiteum]|uniref:uncharacterized protein n=1 Tax=Penicillium malachiteum TaxID=1324776 RepID=UPI00254869D8|nr:uncharacterized protein N7483_012117 [Penicillium malachiteum]KAJ5714936.1 hypothetical protein N7483_012117 [Penicillium malachiteum]